MILSLESLSTTLLTFKLRLALWFSLSAELSALSIATLATDKISESITSLAASAASCNELRALSSPSAVSTALVAANAAASCKVIALFKFSKVGF